MLGSQFLGVAEFSENSQRELREFFQCLMVHATDVQHSMYCNIVTIPWYCSPSAEFPVADGYISARNSGNGMINSETKLSEHLGMSSVPSVL
jgi:hypothetical protein